MKNKLAFCQDFNVYPSAVCINIEIVLTTYVLRAPLEYKLFILKYYSSFTELFPADFALKTKRLF